MKAVRGRHGSANALALLRFPTGGPRGGGRAASLTRPPTGPRTGWPPSTARSR